MGLIIRDTIPRGLHHFAYDTWVIWLPLLILYACNNLKLKRLDRVESAFFCMTDVVSTRISQAFLQKRYEQMLKQMQNSVYLYLSCQIFGKMKVNLPKLRHMDVTLHLKKQLQ